ncbi:MAG: hypothetical protein JOZ49_20555, partial [Mycolicibacterium sp.]|nr:hypothetical protein [Mycolicibacterium sp.]
MAGHTAGVLRAVLVTAAAVALGGCAPTVVDGAAVTAAESGGSDGAVVALMDTGAYATAAGHPFGNAGKDTQGAATLEAHRMAEHVVGPWQVDGE